MQFRKDKLQYDSAVQYCSPMLSSSAAMQCCTAMWHCNVAFAGGSPVTHLQTLAWNAMQSRASEQSSKRASKQPYSCNAMLQCNAAWQCHNAMLHCSWVTGDPPQNIGLQCNATQRKASQQACRHAGKQATSPACRRAGKQTSKQTSIQTKTHTETHP